MSTVPRVSTSRVPLAAAILGVATWAAAQTTAPVIFRGLGHAPIGNAVLQVDDSRNTLEVSTMNPDGGDGVAVDLGGRATSWSADLGTVRSSLPLVMTLHAIADGERISTAILRQAHDRLALGARFTGAKAPTYAVQVYDDGRLVGSSGGLPPTADFYVPIHLPCEFLQNGCSFVAKFRNTPYGECEWGFVFRRAGPVTLPNGTRHTGTEVRLIEEVRPAGHYPYLFFDGISMQTSARALTLFSESIR